MMKKRTLQNQMVCRKIYCKERWGVNIEPIFHAENFRPFLLKFSTKLLTVLNCWYTILADIEKEC